MTGKRKRLEQIPDFPHAACVRKPGDWWFPRADGYPTRRVGSDDHGRDLYQDARPVCVSCPHIADCAVVGAAEPWGMWGGLSPRDRLRIRRAKSRDQAVTRRNAVVFAALDAADPGWWTKFRLKGLGE